MKHDERAHRAAEAARRAAAAAACAAVVVAGACAPRAVAPPTGITPRYPDFVKPDAPRGVGDRAAVDLQERGWLLLQAGDLRNAERAFTQALRGSQTFYPAEAGLGYVRLANRAFRDAITDFERVLAQEPGYVPALVGRGDALLGASDPAEALTTFEAALAVDPSLADVRRRVEVVSLRVQQELLAAARRAAEAGRFDDARGAYERAIGRSPDSGFLYRELATVERRTGQRELALEHLRRAVSLDASDGRAWTLLGEALEEQGDVAGAVDAYEHAAVLEPGAAISAKLDRARGLADLATRPPEYRAIAEAYRITRAELAALLGVKLGALLRRSPVRPAEVMTDTLGTWAAPWILAVTRAGLMDVFANHTFQPAGVVRRADLALAASRALRLGEAGGGGRYRTWAAGRPSIADLPPDNLHYAAAALVVTAGLMPLLDGNTFQPSRPVSGAEAIAIVDRLEELTR